jgi:glutamine synthetase
VSTVKQAGGKSVEGKKLLGMLTKAVDALKTRADKLEKALTHEGGSADKHAKYFRDSVIPVMVSLRDAGDALELAMPHESWPLATYREMLFIK